MNKEEVIECFFKDRELDPQMIKFAEIYNKYLSKEPIQPANLERIETVTNRSEINDKKSSLEKTLSICSAFSRVTIDQNIYSDIVKNRKNHNIFLDLEEDDPKEKKWYYKDEKDNIFGPYSSQQMNDYFQLYKFTEKFKVKKKFENDDFFQFRILIKRYYKKILAEKMDIEKTRSRALSKKTQEFRKGDRIKFDKNKNKIEKFSSQGRVTRVLSDEVKPNLYFLDNIIEESGSEDEDYIPNTRIRSLTSATK